MTKIYAPYVIYKDESGFYNETKFINDIDFDILEKQNGLVTSYYDDEVKVEAINGVLSNNNIILIRDNKMVELSFNELENKVTDLFIQLAKESIHAEYMDYKRDDKDWSIAQDIAEILKNFGETIDLEDKKEFNKENYLKLAKELSFYYSLHVPMENKEIHNYIREIRNVTTCINTILAVNDVLDYTPEEAPYKHFRVNDVENEDGETDHYFNYSRAELMDSKHFPSLQVLNSSKQKANKKSKFKM